MNVELWADGSGTRADGPACIGVVVLVDGAIVCEASEHVGPGTNNVAELRAIRRALYLAETIAGPDAPTIVHSDSAYAIGVVTKPWNAVANAELVAATRRQAARFSALRWQLVPGHAGVPMNELADWLATRARVAWFRASGVESKLRARPVA